MDTGALERQRRVMLEARRDWVQAQAEVKRLATEFRNAAAPTEAMGQALGRAQAQARNAKSAFDQQRETLHRLGGTAQSAFAQFISGSRQMGAAGSATAAANNQIAGSATRASTAQRTLAPAVRQTATEMQNAAGRTNSFNGALLGLGNGTRQSLSLLQRLRGEVLSLTASYVGFQAAIQNIGGAVGAFRDLESIQSRLGAVFQQDTNRVAQEVDWLRSEADRLGISLSVLGNQYAKFAVAADASNFSAAATRDIFLSVAEAGRVNKLSLDQLQGTFLAIEQIISKGKFTSEEVRRQLGDRLPGAFSILASALGLTTAELDKMMSNGDLLATEGNLLKFADEMTRRFGPQLSSSLDTVTTDIGRFENEVFKSQLRVADGFIPALRDALQAFNQFSDSAEGRQFFAQLGVQVGRFISILAEVPQYFDLITVSVQAFVAVKLAGFILGVVGRIKELRTGFTGLGQTLAFIGPQMQQVGAAQRVLSQGFAQTIGAIDSYRARLLASTASTGTARAGTVMFAGSLGILRGAMMATAGVARAMWIAIGGLPGIIATGITLAVTGWLTSTNDATAAIVEHKRIVEQVKGAYKEAENGALTWGEAVRKALTLPTLEENARAAQRLWTSALDAIERKLGNIRGKLSSNLAIGSGDPFLNLEAQSLISLVDQLSSRQITVEKFKTELGELYQTLINGTDLKEAARQLLLYSDEVDEAGNGLATFEQILNEAEAALDVFNDKADETTETTYRVNDAVDGANESFDKSAYVETYTKAIEDLKSKIPGLADEMDRLKSLTELNKTAWEGMVAAWEAGDYGKIAQLVGLWGQGVSAANNKFFGGAGGGSAADLIKRFEGYQAQAYWDVNHYRVGYGSDTVTLSDGSIRKVVEGMTTTLADAERDLARRIGEFQDTVKREIGSDRFNAMSPQQQAALTSIAYNYGNLTRTGQLDAFKTGSVEEIVTAIRSLGSHNGGINANRRNQEAAIFGSDGTSYQLSQQQYELEQERLELIREQNQATQDRLAAGQFDISQQQLINSGKEMQAEIEKAIAEARKENPNITEAEIEQIRQQTMELYNLKNVVDEKAAAEERVNQLYTLRQQLLEQIKMAEENGDVTQAQSLELRITGVNTQLDAAIQKAIAMWQAVGGPEADAAIAKLQTMGMSIQQNTQKMGLFGLSMQQWGSIAGSFADGLVGVFDAFAQAIANGENAVEALGMAFLKFAADFLIQIGQMITKQLFFNMLQAFFPGLPIGHTGGVVGTKAIGGGNGKIATTAPWVRNAFTYHTGGIAGFKPDEVNATLKVGEEILTEEDPRHRNNLGGEREAQGQQGRPIKQVLVLDPRELANAMSSKAGEEVIITTLKRNAPTVRRLLGS